MIYDLFDGIPASSTSADICIIGAGAAGILLAVELARHGKRVLLLEGGGPDVEESSQEPYRSDIAGLNHNGIHIGRFRSSGGTTTRWGGQILELDELDFEDRPWIEGSGWQIPKRELKPYYDRAIKLEGLGQATLDDDDVWKEVKVDPPAIVDFQGFFSRWCPETNYARLHGRALASDPRIEVWLHANVVAPVYEGTRFRGMRCRTLTGIEHVFHADQFVWCMGGIESARFFLQPEHASMPWQTNGLLGRHFQDHIICTGAKLELTDARRFHDLFENVFSRGYKYQPKLRLDRKRQQEHGTLNVAAMIFFKSELDEVAGQLKGTAKKLLRGRIADTSRQEIVGLVRNAPLLARQSWRYAVHHRAYIPPDVQIELGVNCEQEPRGRSSITLSDSRDSLGMLRTRLDWQVSDHEISSIATLVEIAANSFRGIANVIPDPDLQDPERFKAKCGDNYHHMGGMRMATSPSEGLVDLDLKLHGMDNGYVCSAAVFPTSGFSNPTHTVLALAVRLAEHLGKH